MTVSSLDTKRSTLILSGLRAPLTVCRDAFGVAHVRAANEHDAWFGQGFVAAQDRLWQMEYDRRRATGRWAEAVGTAGVAGDVLSRRLRLADSAQADVAAMSAQTRAMFAAYAAGVNAFLQSGQPLPPEYALAGIAPEPWEPWHSTAGFKIRHVLMGPWQTKLAQAQLLAMIGPKAYARLDGRPPVGSVVILPPGGAVRRVFAEAAADLAAAAEQLGFLAEYEAGSNSWAVYGSRTTTGMPVLCNDSHRALDVPSVYWQVHVACPAFDVIGATFPGLPGFPHFGHNGHVAWNITHTAADYQDLYVEQFDPADPSRYRTPGGWATADRRRETIRVAGGEPVTFDVWRTRHGPVVHGDPRRGYAIALRYTATDAPCRGFECIRRMVVARTVAALHEAQREWVDPVNNLVAADVEGNIGYLTRGYLPIRSSPAHRQFPAAGWTGENEWVGRVAYEDLPRAINPPEGFIATANQAVLPDERIYIAHEFSSPSRAERIVELLTAKDVLSPAEIATLQGDTTSRPARTWGRYLASVGPFDGEAERARAMLAGFDGNLLPGSAQALLYGCFRRAVGKALFRPIVGRAAWDWLVSPETTVTHGLITRWMANVVAAIDEDHGETRRGVLPTPTGMPTPTGAHGENDGCWTEALQDAVPAALAEAWRGAVERCGPEPARWTWAAVHRTNAKHPLLARFPEQAAALNPPSVPVGGDGDTIQAASYLWGDRPRFDIVGLSVYRQVVDLADVPHASYVIPGGVSGVPGSPHFTDQLDLWRTHQRIPMRYTWADVEGTAASTVRFLPR